MGWYQRRVHGELREDCGMSRVQKIVALGAFLLGAVSAQNSPQQVIRSDAATGEKHVGCYYGVWAYTRLEFNPWDNLNVWQCTILRLFSFWPWQVFNIAGRKKRCIRRKFGMKSNFHPKENYGLRSSKHHHQNKSFLKQELVSPSIDQRKFIKSLKNLNKHSKT